MESQAITKFQTCTKENQLEKFLTVYNAKFVLHTYLAQWKNEHNRYRKYRKEDFCYDGFMYDISSSSHTILYIFDYKYNDRQSMRRIWKMQNFICKHCFDTEINSNSISYLVLNKTNSRCIDTESYVNNFGKNILQEINIIRPTTIVCCGSYDTVSKLFQKNMNNEILSAIKYIPIIEIPSVKINVNDKVYQLHFEYVWFRKFGWNI